jgi:photosystem II stability/assembly factor-like uncharacterized protein
MFNARIGFISDNSGSSSIRKTTDGGLNWIVNVNGVWFNDILFADSLTGWYSNVNGIYKTTNGGNNWQIQAIPSGPNILQLGISRLSCINKDTLWAVGNSTFYPNSVVRGMIMRTTNGGDNWLFQIPDTSFGIPLLGNIQFINRNFGWAYTSTRGIHTTNGGDITWYTGVKQISSQIPKQFGLFQNFPNPFNPKTMIHYQITENSSEALLSVYDITGKHIIDLVNQKLEAGTYEVDFDGSEYSSGVYLYRLTVTTEKEVNRETKKMILIK